MSRAFDVEHVEEVRPLAVGDPHGAARGERGEVLECVVQHHAVVGDVEEGGRVWLEAREGRLREAAPAGVIRRGEIGD